MAKRKSRVSSDPPPKKYSFSKILTKDAKGKIDGPMGPINVIKSVSATLERKFSGAIRVNNLQPFSESSTYDHILLVKRYSVQGVPASMYCLVVDMGVDVIPAHMWFDDEPIEEVKINDRYTHELTQMAHHANNVENIHATPIIVLSKEEFVEMCKDAEAQNMFKISA